MDYSCSPQVLGQGRVGEDGQETGASPLASLEGKGPSPSHSSPSTHCLHPFCSPCPPRDPKPPHFHFPFLPGAFCSHTFLAHTLSFTRCPLHPCFLAESELSEFRPSTSGFVLFCWFGILPLRRALLTLSGKDVQRPDILQNGPRARPCPARIRTLILDPRGGHRRVRCYVAFCQLCSDGGVLSE